MDTANTDLKATGEQMHALAARLYPICRSITGDGVRQTFAILQELLPLAVHDVPSGTQVFDWQVPQEWNIRDAYIKDLDGHRVVDFQHSNLHVVSGSIPVRRNMSWGKLKHHLHTLPQHPTWIPYRTSFHQEEWGFCLAHERYLELDGLGDRNYRVCIDATLEDGALTYGELVLPGTTADEVLISTHVCHPSLANDNLSGLVVATWLARNLQSRNRHYTYRFLFIPATIGAITWLALNEATAANVRHGLILSVIGDAGPMTYRRSRKNNADIDRAVEHVLTHTADEYSVLDFEPFGFDQRQFCSPGFDLPMGCLMRTPNDQYPEYHTSADNLELLQPAALADSLDKCIATMELLEGNATYVNQNSKCEPRLGPRGLYHAFGQHPSGQCLQKATLWVLNLSDGHHTLLDIAERSGLPFAIIRHAADLLAECQLISDAADRVAVTTYDAPAAVELVSITT